MAAPKARALSGTPSPSDIVLACEALQELKRQLKSIASVGGGTATEGLLLATVDDCAEAVVVTNDRAEIRTVNGAAARLTGLTTRELQALTFWDITHSSSQMDFDVLWREFLRARLQRGHYTIRNRGGDAVEVAYCSEAHVLPGQHVSVLRRRTDL
jgi:PAS domain S-box-containing protein